MSGWTGLSDDFDENRKALATPLPAFKVWVCSWSWTRRNRTNGILLRVEAEALIRKLGLDPKRVIPMLLFVPPGCQAGCWEDLGDGSYRLHEAEQGYPLTEAEKVRRWRHNLSRRGTSEKQLAALRSEVFARDGYTCRYCGAMPEPRWLVMDHIIPLPEGPDELDNLAAACRSCNKRKGGRTPEQAGMELLDLVTAQVTRNLPVTDPRTREVSPSHSPSHTHIPPAVPPPPDPVTSAVLLAWERLTGKPIRPADQGFADRLGVEYPRLTASQLVADLDEQLPKFMASNGHRWPPLKYFAMRWREMDARVADEQSGDGGPANHRSDNGDYSGVGDILGGGQ